MKIGFVLDDGLDKPDGVQQYVLTLGQWLATQGHEVHYLVGETKRTDVPNVHSLSRNMAVRFNQNRMSMPLPTSRRYIRTLLRKERFDVLHVQMPYSPWLAARIIQAAPSKTVIFGTFHIIPFSKLEQLATTVLARWLRPSLHRFDYVWSVSQPAQAFARRSFGMDSEVLPNVVNYAALRSHRQMQTPDKDGLSIVFLGRLVPRKGSLELLKALDYLSTRTVLNKKVKVIIGGRGPLEAGLKAYCAKSNLSGMIELEFRGFVAENEKGTLLGAADIAVFPSLGGESFGIVLIEAMAAGAGVVIGGNNAGYASVLGAWPECLVDPRNTKQFADSLEVLLKHSSLRKQLHEAQQITIKQYDVAVVGPQLVLQYETVIAKNR